MDDGAPATTAAAWRAWLEEGGADRPFAEHWRRFLALDGTRGPGDPPVCVWEPDPRTAREANAARLAADLGLASFAALHRWSVTDRAGYWGAALERLGVEFVRPPDRVLDDSGGAEHPRWLPGARLNVAASCFRGPDRPAVLCMREGSDAVETTSLRTLERLADRFAHGLRARGLGPGDGVALYMPMDLRCVAAYLGTVKAGLHVVSVADSFPAVELARRVDLGGARLVVAAEGYVRAGRTLDLYGKVREAGAPAAVVTPLGGAVPLRPGDTWWDDFLGEDAPFEAVPRDPYDVTNVLFSSGTTGTPKAIPWTHLTPLKAAVDGRFHHDVRPGDVVAWPTNVGWMMGPWLVYASLLNGGSMALFEGGPAGAGFCRFVERTGVTMLGVVPSLVRAWRAAEAADGSDWSRVRVFSSTGEASSRGDFLWLMSRNGYRAPVIEYCGGTEIGGGHVTGSVLQPASPATFTTPALGIDFVVLDGDGAPARPGETGEVFLVPPSLGLSQSLLNGDHHDVYFARCPRGPGGEVLRRHGDAMVRLPGGFWRAEGRADDTMNLGGIKVSSLEIERVAAAHPSVHECAAVAVRPGGEGADALVLFVVPVPGAAPDPAALRGGIQALISRDLNPLFRVHDVVPLEALPRTASNKTMRRELRARYGGG